ncbi:MAG: 2-oxo-4-hydroxy-4-carboxy-5-ureidoimidazoline decarboxylase [Pseudomonadota bacterium]
MSAKFQVLPSGLGRAAFVDRFGSIYEHSPWIAERVWDGGLAPEHNVIDTLAEAMSEILNGADDDAKLALIRAHPDLAGKAAIRGELTDASTSEQAGAGLDQCTPDEFTRFQDLNAAYTEKFGFPFILAVKGKGRAEILKAFETRISNTPAEEFRTAIEQIHRIARLRLADL